MEAGRSVKAVLKCLGCSIRPSPTLPAIALATAGLIPGSSNGLALPKRLCEGDAGRLALDQ